MLRYNRVALQQLFHQPFNVTKRTSSKCLIHSHHQYQQRLWFSDKFSSSSGSSVPSNDTAFVSKHYNVDKSEILDCISRMETTGKCDSLGDYHIKVCKLCDKGNKEKQDNLWKMRIRPDGSYYCHRCAKGGKWFDLKKIVYGTKNVLIESTADLLSNSNKYVNSKYASGRGAGDDNKSKELDKAKTIDSIYAAGKIVEYVDAATYSTNLFPLDQTLVTEEAKKAQEYLLTTRGLKKDTLMRYGVGVTEKQQFIDSDGKWANKTCITFPWIVLTPPDQLVASNNKSTVTVRVKYRALETKGMQRILPKGGIWGFFGWHIVRHTDTAVIITEGEYDAMAVAQALSELPDDHAFRRIPCISLPNGCNSLPTELLPLLERFKKIYMWMDNDKSGQEGCEKFSKKLGIYRCHVVRPESNAEHVPKDANDALRLNVVDLITNLLLKSKLYKHDKILSFSDFREDALNALKKRGKDGVQPVSIPTLGDICKGFRKGELVVFTGPTGGGKTTILSQLGLDFSKQGVPILWGSFEIKNSQLAKKMLQQYLGAGDIALLDQVKLNKLADDFEMLPIKFMNFHGGSDIDEIIEAMDYCVYRDDTQVIILDNLQFLMPRVVANSRRPPTGFERFEYQDVAIDKFRKFASEKNVNIILVIHPRKEDENAPLKMSSISGTAKATQEADLVLILQRVADRMWLDIKKNRYDGTLGTIHLSYSQHRSSFYEVDTPSPNVSFQPKKL